MILCVYGLAAGAAPRLTIRGLSGERLRIVREGSVAAIAGELRRAPRPTRDNLQRYDAVMRRLAERFPALLPARFGTTFDDPAELSFVLRARQASFHRALAHVRGRAQMTVRVIAAGSASAFETSSAVKSRNPAHTEERPWTSDSVGRVARSGPAFSGREYLRERAAVAARERTVPGFEPIRGAVRRWIRDERVEKRQAVASVYHLVPRASAESYRSAAERAAAAANVRLVITGPWPPYAFADFS